MAKKKKVTFKRVYKNADIPASHGELMEVRSELKSDIATVRLEMKKGFVSMEAKFEKLAATVHATNAIVEEQNSRNKFVMDAIQISMDNLQKINDRVSRLEKTNYGSSDL